MTLLRPLVTILGPAGGLAGPGLGHRRAAVHPARARPGRGGAGWRSPALLLRHAAVTLQEILLGILLGSLIGAASAMLLAASRTAQRWLMPLLVVSQALPVFALAPHPGALARLRHAVQGRDGRADHLLPGHRRLPGRAAAHRAGLARARAHHGRPALGDPAPYPGARGPARPHLRPAGRRRRGADRGRRRRVGRLQRRARLPDAARQRPDAGRPDVRGPDRPGRHGAGACGWPSTAPAAPWSAGSPRTSTTACKDSPDGARPQPASRARHDAREHAGLGRRQAHRDPGLVRQPGPRAADRGAREGLLRRRGARGRADRTRRPQRPAQAGGGAAGRPRRLLPAAAAPAGGAGPAAGARRHAGGDAAQQPRGPGRRAGAVGGRPEGPQDRLLGRRLRGRAPGRHARAPWAGPGRRRAGQRQLLALAGPARRPGRRGDRRVPQLRAQPDGHRRPRRPRLLPRGGRRAGL